MRKSERRMPLQLVVAGAAVAGLALFGRNSESVSARIKPPISVMKATEDGELRLIADNNRTRGVEKRQSDLPRVLTATAMPTATEVPTKTLEPTATATATATMTLTETATATPMATATEISTEAPTETVRPSATATATMTSTEESVGMAAEAPARQEVTKPLSVEIKPEVLAKREGEVILDVLEDTQDTLVSCEASAVGMAAELFGRPPDGYETWEEYLISNVPSDPNPNLGFRGDVRGGSQNVDEAYGVYPLPLARALDEAGVPSKVLENSSYEEVADYIRRGFPVVVWISGDMDAKVERWVDPRTGEEVPLLYGEHAWTVVGVSADNRRFLVHEPYPGQGGSFWVNRNGRGFVRWADLGNMALVIGQN